MRGPIDPPEEEESNHIIKKNIQLIPMMNPNLPSVPGGYGLYQTQKLRDKSDIDEKKFIEQYKIGEVEHFGKSKDHHMTYRRELSNHDRFRIKEKVPYDKRSYNTYNGHPKDNEKIDTIHLDEKDISLIN